MKYPELTPYQFASNSPIAHIDLDGLEKTIYLINFANGKSTTTKIELEKAGPLGDGIAVQMSKAGKKSNFYGKTVASAEEFTKAYEGKKLKRYNDQYGNPTIGIGHLIKKSEEKKYPVGGTITDKEADELFTADYSTHSAEIKGNITETGLTKSQTDALVDFGFNTGANSVTKFKKEQGADFFLGYLKGGNGIIKRRIAEFLSFKEGIYAKFDLLGKKDSKTLEKTISDAQPAASNTDKAPSVDGKRNSNDYCTPP